MIPDRRAAVAVLLAAAVVPLVGFIGLATDSARGYLAKSRLSEALDAAALAGGRALLTEHYADDIQMFFDANFPPGFLGATVSGPNFVVSGDSETLELTASAEIATTFMKILGVDTLNVNARTVVQRATRGMELVLIMDNTGSMRSGGKIDAMKTAATDLVNILYGERETVNNFWVSLVPYTVAVNIGSQHSDWLVGYDPTLYMPTTWKGCVEARTVPGDQNDLPPATQGWTPFFFPADTDNIWPPIDETNEAQNNGTGPNLGCGPAITPLTAEKTAVLAAINEMLPWHRGGTMSNLGLAWGWRAISPLWRGLWGGATPDNLPLDYEEPLMDKVAILLTDGVNQWYDHPPAGPDGSDYGAYGRLGWGVLGTTNKSAATTEINTRMTNTCEAMKANGIVIYTITFQLSDGATQQLFRDCASTPDQYFNSPTNEDLQDVFREIGTQLSNLRLAE